MVSKHRTINIINKIKSCLSLGESSKDTSFLSHYNLIANTKVGDLPDLPLFIALTIFTQMPTAAKLKVILAKKKSRTH